MAGVFKQITGYRNKKSFSAVAIGAISSYRVVKAEGIPVTLEPGIDYAETPNSQTPIGITDNAFDEILKTTFEDGDPIAVNYEGIVPLEMSGIGTLGNAVSFTTDGFGIEHETPVVANGWVIGIAMQDWVDGQIIPVLISRQYITTPAP